MSEARTVHVLMVEDSVDDAELVIAELRRAGFDPHWKRVQTEADLVTALESGDLPDLILSDYSMPRFDGLRAVDLVRGRGLDTPFILISGTLGEEAAVEAMKRGCTDYLLKDRLARLGHAVERALDRAQFGQERRSLQSQLLLQSTALETAANAVLMTDRKGVILWVNPAFCALTGYAAQEVVGKTPRVLKSGKHDQAFYRDFWQTLIEGRTWRGEFINRRKDGNLYYGQQTVTPVRSEAGTITHFIGIMDDITERKRTEEALRENERVMATLLGNLPGCAYRALPDKPRTLKFISWGVFDLTGYSLDDFLVRRTLTYADIVHPEDRDRIWADVQNALENRDSYELVYRIRTRGGQEKWVLDKGQGIDAPGGGLSFLEGFITDITERKQAEQRLATHHALTRVLAEANTLSAASKQILETVGRNLQWDVGGLWAVDRTTRRLRCVEIWHPPSTEFLEFVNFSRQTTFRAGEGLPGRVFKSGQPVWIADLAEEQDLVRKPFLTRIGLGSAVAFPIRLHDQVHGVIEFFSARVRPPDSQLLSMLGTAGSQIGQFIERTRVEEQLRQAQKMEAFGQLAGGVAHDFNNILAVIMGYTQLLLEADDRNAEDKDYLKQVYTAGERAAHLTRQLLTFSRNKEMEVIDLNLNEVIANMSKMLGRVIREDINLQCNFATGLPTVQADEGMMEQVLMNLAVNARDAMPKGGQLIIGTDRVVHDAASIQSNPEARDGEFVRLTVQDTGCGMTPEIQARIFEPFFTTKDIGKGTGLGLATVYGIVKQHRGWIEVDSKVGGGTIFRIFFPANPVPEVAPQAAAVESPIAGGKETILLVEDEAALRGLTRLVLQRQGYEVLEAGSGVEALELWRQHGGRIDLLLTDMIMPEGLTGRDLAKQLQALKPALKVIYASGYSADAGGTTFRQRESSPFLQKPYHPQKLARMVRECLDK
jgi:PAS domain S-box-containing protein